MKKILCQNQRMVDGGVEPMCHRFEVSIPDVMVTLLRSLQGDPDGRIIVRCPACKDHSRFAEILVLDGKLTYRTIEGSVMLGDELVFDDVVITAEGG